MKKDNTKQARSGEKKETGIFRQSEREKGKEVASTGTGRSGRRVRRRAGLQSL